MIAIAGHEITTDRMKSAFGVAIIHLLIGYALLSGLSVPLPHAIEAGLKLFSVVPPPRPPQPSPQPRPAQWPRPNGAAAPPNLKAQATEIAAPPPVVLVPQPPPVIVADKAEIGSERNTGAAPLAGPGTGSGGIGDGTGSDTGGDGGGGGGVGSPLRQTGGRISGRDYPEAPFRAHIGGTVWVRYIVNVRGRVEQCGIQRSSGNAELDDTTCRLIIERFRFKPKRNAQGKPVPGVVVEDHHWVVDMPPPEGQ